MARTSSGKRLQKELVLAGAGLKTMITLPKKTLGWVVVAKAGGWIGLIVALSAALGLLVAVVPLFGNQGLIVRSGSMEPVIGVGDLVVVRPLAKKASPDRSSYKAGDIIAYKSEVNSGLIVTHRIIEVKNSGGSVEYLTKGDANNNRDQGLVSPDQVLGRKIMVVPYIGKGLAFGKTKAGYTFLILLPACLVIVSEAKIIWREVQRIRLGRRKNILPHPAGRVAPAILKWVRDKKLKEVEESVGIPRLITRSKVLIPLDSVVARTVVFFGVILLLIPSTWALYTDSEISSGNVLQAADDFGGASSFGTSVLPSDSPGPSPTSVGASVVINEVMWMGSHDGTSAKTQDEWIELRNLTNDTVDISGWTIDNAGEGVSQVLVPLGDSIGPNGYYLISHFSAGHSNSAINDSVVVDLVEANLGLNNGGEQLILRNTSGTEVDSTPEPAGGSWAFGENDNDTPRKRSMQRQHPPGDGTMAENWGTCTNDACNDTIYWDGEGGNYGTPKAGNL